MKRFRPSIRLCRLFAAVWCTAVCGCSVMSNENSPRPTPLPPNTETRHVVNLYPEPVPSLTPEAEAYLKYVESSKPKDRTDGASASDAGMSAASQKPPVKVESKQKSMPTGQSKRERENREKQQRREQEYKKQQQLPFEKKVQSLDDAQMMLKNQKFALEAVPLPTGITDPWYAGNEAALDAERQSARVERDQNKAKNIPVPPRPGERDNYLVLTGGAAHGAYQIGVLCGWHDAGTMPEFDVITGVSTGALIAVATFAGPEYLAEARRLYTSVNKDDVYKIKKWPPLGIGTPSLASNAPLRKLVTDLVSRPGYFETIAAEHARGRRLYVGTTNLDTMRFVTWDLGAIACEGTPESRRLYVDIVLGASAMPPFFTPSEITVTIDGKNYTEMHVDGGTTRNVFMFPPSHWPGEKADPNGELLAGGNVYVLVGGRLYEEAVGTKPKLVPAGLRALSSLVGSCLRAELFRCYTNATEYDMNFRLSSIPPDYLPLFRANDFNPAEMSKLFCVGYNRAQNDWAWDEELTKEAVTEIIPRRSTCLTIDMDGSDERGGFAPPRRGTASAPQLGPTARPSVSGVRSFLRSP